MKKIPTTLITIAVLQIALCDPTLSRLSAEESLKATIAISTVGVRPIRQTDADIIRYGAHFYIVFARELAKDEGEFHVLRSVDCRDWKTVATLRSKFKERRPDVTHSTHYLGRPVWFSKMPSGRLCITGRSAKATVLWSSEDGSEWREELDIDLSRSYSRILWKDNRAYCASDESLSCGEKSEFFRLESAFEGLEPETTYKLSHNSHTLSGPRESQIAFTKNGAISLLAFRAYSVDKVRRLLIPSTSYAQGKLGVSKAPFKDWKWKPVDMKFGVPNLLVLSDDRVLATIFIDGNKPRNALCQVDEVTGKLTELLRLPTVATRHSIGLTEHDGYVWACFSDAGNAEDDGRNPAVLKVAKIKLEN